MTEHRDWREAKIPQWAVESIKSEMMSNRILAALAWPTETCPTPVNMRWGDYDKMLGEFQQGEYWSTYISSKAFKVEVYERDQIPAGREISNHSLQYKRILFATDGGAFQTNVQRGPLYLTERDANLAHLWEQCSFAAAGLALIRERLK